METTLNNIFKFGPCGQDKDDNEGWWKLLNYLGKTKPDCEPLPLLTILDSNGLDDALWALRSVNGYEREMRLFACWCACQTLHIFERECPGDLRPRQAIETSALYAEGLATAAARDAATAAALAAAWAAAWAAARDAATAAARDAARDAARAAARDAARAAAWAAAWDAQEKEFIQLCNLGERYMPLI